MGGYIGSRPVVVQVDGYQREESESRYVNVTGDDFSGHLDFVDDAKARFGDSDELQIWTQSDGDGNSYLDGNKIIIRSAAGVARLSITSNDVDITSGALKVGGTTVINSSREITAKKLTLTDDGASSPTLQVRSDDNSPWPLVVGNDAVSTNALGGLNVYQNGNSGNVEMWTRTPDRSGGFIFRTKGITSNTSSDDLLSLPAAVNDTATFYRRPQVNHSSPYIILNDTDAADTNNMVGWLSFQRQGAERGFVGYGSASNDQLYLQNYDGNVVLSAGSNDAVNISNGNLQIAGNNVLYSNGDINGFGHIQTGTVSTDGAVIKNHHVRSSFESGTVIHPFWQNDWANFRKRGGTVTWGGLTGTPSDANTDLMFTTSTYVSVNGGDYSGSTITITLTTPPKNFTYGSWAGITFNNESWSPSSCKIETSTNGGSTWTTRLNATNSSVQYLTSFSSGSTQTNAIRFTLGLPAQNGASGSLRIQNIFAFGYNSSGMEQYFVPRGGGQMYGDLGIGTVPSATYGPTMHIKGNNPNLRLEGTASGSWAYFELNNTGYERSFGMASDGTFRITSDRGNMDNNIQLSLYQNGRLNVPETISAGTQPSALKGYFYENTADQNGSSKPTSVLGVAAYTNSNGEGPSIDFSSVWVGSGQYQQDNWNEGWVVGRIAGVYDNHVSNGGALAFYTHTGTSATGGAGNTSVAERFRIKPEGQLTVSGTTPIATQEGILRSGNIITSVGTNQTTPTMHGFGQLFIRDWASGRYVHMKTDIPTGTSNHTFGMYAIKVVGYVYGSAKTIDGIWAAHNWNGNVYSKAHTNNGSQAFVYNQYVSSDGYIVLVGDVGSASNSMYAGWTMDFHYTNTNYAAHTGTSFDAHTVSAHSISTSTSGVY